MRINISVFTGYMLRTSDDLTSAFYYHRYSPHFYVVTAQCKEKNRLKKAEENVGYIVTYG